MSPNLSSQHFPPNSILYEQVLFNLLSLVGVGQNVHKESLIRSGRNKQLEQSYISKNEPNDKYFFSPEQKKK